MALRTSKTKTKTEKVVEEKAVEEKAVEEKAVEEKEGKETKFVSPRLSIYHPYQNVRFRPGVQTACKLDSWVKSQLDAGVLIEA